MNQNEKILHACWIKGDGIDIAVSVSAEATAEDIQAAFREAQADTLRAIRNGQK